MIDRAVLAALVVAFAASAVGCLPGEEPEPTPTPTATPTATATPKPRLGPTSGSGSRVGWCSGRVTLPTVPGFEAWVECAGALRSALLTITVKTDSFTTFDYPIKIQVVVDPPIETGGFYPGSGYSSYLHKDDNVFTGSLSYDRDSLRFEWPKRPFGAGRKVTGVYVVTVKASTKTGDWVTIAAGAVTIQ
jgi:hypothetical protein